MRNFSKLLFILLIGSVIGGYGGYMADDSTKTVTQKMKEKKVVRQLDSLQIKVKAILQKVDSLKTKRK